MSAMTDYTVPDREKSLIGKIRSWLDRGKTIDTFKGGRKHNEHYDLWMKKWDNWKTHEAKWTAKANAPPETWLTRKKARGEKRYTHTPEGGFSGALGVATTQKKKLLGA